MDEDKRKQKLEDGKAKFASYRKKRLSRSKKKQNSPTVLTPRDVSHSEEVGAGDSTAVQTGDDNSLRAFSPSDESDRTTTTADEISTEEEVGFHHNLSEVERIQELETRVSDQMIALQKLTLENKQLRSSSLVDVLDSKSADQVDIVAELRNSISQTAEQVCQLQQQLTKATDAVMDSGGEQNQIVNELTETRLKLDEYKNAISKQDEAMQAMATKLADKSLQAEEAVEKCRSLQSDLDRSQSLLVSSGETASVALQSLREEKEKENALLRANLEEAHDQQVAALKIKHQKELKRQMEEYARTGQDVSSAYDAEDMRAYREQVAMLTSQLETSYRDIEKMKRDHDKEVIHLNQQLVSAVDEYETKLQEERMQAEDLERRLEMSDTVSSEIQASFSKQLEQLEEERDALRQQLRQSQVRAKESAATKKQIKDLEDEIVSYQTELADATQRLEDADKQRRLLRDQVERLEEAAQQLRNEKSKVDVDLEAAQSNASQLKNDAEERLKQHESCIEELNTKITDLEQLISQERHSSEEKLHDIQSEHSEELKHLHSQHHRQMDEIKQEMERQLGTAKAQLDEERKNQLETVKDVHERSRDREISRLHEEHLAELEKLKEDHANQLEALRVESEEVKAFAEERLKLEMREDFSSRLENELNLLRRSMEQENSLALAELESKHAEDMRKVKDEHVSELQSALKEQQIEYEDALQAQKKELDNAIEALKEQFKSAEETLEAEHAEAVAKMEEELKEIQMKKESEKDEKSTALDVEKELKSFEEENESLKQKIKELETNIEEVSKQLDSERAESALKEASINSLQTKIAQDEECSEEYREEIGSLKNELTTVQQERDQIFSQAEESQKRLGAIHHDETARMEQEIQQMKSDHQKALESMQIEIESLRTSRTDLQDLKSQLLARNASVEELEKLREEFANEKEALLRENEETLNKLRTEHEVVAKNFQEKVEQLMSDLDAANDKLAEAYASPEMLESSPMRSVSAMSDYDSSNVHALNKDYRSAMTLTHVSGVSGLSESPAGIQEEPLGPADEDPEEEQKQSENDVLREQLEEMRQTLADVQQQLAESKASYESDLQSMAEEHASALEKALQSQELEKSEATEAISKEHQHALDELETKERAAREELEETHRREMTQIRLECASETAKQVEEETESLRKQLLEAHEAEMDSLKLKLEEEANEKQEEQRKAHEQELEKQSEDMSSSMQTRLAAVMSEFHEQKQLSLMQLTNEHAEEMKIVRDDLENKLQEVQKRESDLTEAWDIKKTELEGEIETLKSDLEKSRELYRTLSDDLASGNNDHLRNLQAAHNDELEAQRKRLEEEHDARQEAALKKQAQVYEQAQEDFIKLHKAQLEQFTAAEKEEAGNREKETNRQIDEACLKLKKEFDDQRAAHNEELNTVSTKLGETLDKNRQLEEEKNDMAKTLEAWQAERTKELADMKTTLVNQHMQKFEEVAMTLEQDHKQEMDKLISLHQEEKANLRCELNAMKKELESAAENLKREVDEVKDHYKDYIRPDNFEAQVKELSDGHEKRLEEEKQAHEDLLKQIENEISAQEQSHKEGMKKILRSQEGELEALQKQFDEALKSATEAGLEETQKLSQRVVELETQLVETEQLRAEMEELKENRAKLESVVSEQDTRIKTWQEEQTEERDAYEKKLEEISEALSASKEDYQDLSARIEFERAEYEAELESAQEEIRGKEENLKELQAEVNHKIEALNSLQKQYEQLTSRRERETQEGDNLLKMLRDDLDRINKERDAVSASNDQLLLTLTELVRANQRCEEVIARRLQALPIIGAEQNAAEANANLSQSTGSNADTETTGTPRTTSLSGSFVDEGLDVSQRLAESMFVGPELDPSAREVVTTAGVRVSQAVERVLDMLNNTVLQLNAAQQAQTLLGDELQRVVEAKQSASDQPEDLIKEQSNRIAQLQRQLSDTEEALALLQQEQSRDLTDREGRLAEEKALLEKQREALLEGRDEKELSLVRTTDELSREKQMLVELHQKERDRLEKAARQLEEAMEENARNAQERESAYVAQIEDLNSQIAALSKQNESDSRFNAELVSDREEEREHFEQQMEKMRNEVELAREIVNSEALLTEKVSHLEEDLETRQQQMQEKEKQLGELQLKVKEQNALIEELRAQPSYEQEIETLKAQNANAQSELEESKRQRDVIQQELYANVMRISALEAQLDRYRHGVDEESIAARERAETAERQRAEQKMEDLEERETQIEMLVEQQQVYQNQVIEKEEQVEKLLHELDQMKEFEAENVKLKADFEELQAQQSSSNQPHAGQSGQLEALSQQLLDDKNAEIDELRRRVEVLRGEAGNESEAESEMFIASLQNQLREVIAENEDLREKLRSAQEQLERTQRTEEENVSTEENTVEAAKSESSSSRSDTGIQEVDLTVDDLVRSDESSRLQHLEGENALLREELAAAEARAKEQLVELEKSLLRIAPETKEKIRDLEERLGKEQNDLEKTLSSSSSSEDAHDDSCKSKNGEGSDEVKEILMEIEAELRGGQPNVFNRILNCKDEELLDLKEARRQLEIELSNTKNEVCTLKQQVADLQHELNEPDVQIRMKSDDGDSEDDHDLDVKLEQVQSAPFEEDRDDLLDDKADEVSEVRDSSASETPIDRSDSHDELKILLDAKEQEISKRDQVLLEKQKLLEEKEGLLTDLFEKYESVAEKCKEMEEKLENVGFEFDEYKQKHPDTSDDLAEEENLRIEVEAWAKKATSAQEERNRITSQLNDVQRECASLLDDNHRLERENKQMTEDAECHTSKLQELEDLVTDRENELQQVQAEASELQQQVTVLANELQSMQCVVDDATEEKFKLEEDVRNMSAQHKKLVIDLENEIKRLSASQNIEVRIDGSGDGPRKTSTDEVDGSIKNPDSKNELEQLKNDVDDLQEELQNLTFKNEELEAEIESLKQSHADEMQITRSHHQTELRELQRQLDEAAARQYPVLQDDLQTSQASLTRTSSTESKSSDDDNVQTKMEELREEHQHKMEEIQRKFAQELKDAVAAATKEQEERNEAVLNELEEKHKKEMAELVSESITVDSELAKRLRDELDHADQLDNNLIKQLSSIAPVDEDTLSSSSPVKEADVSERLQQLLSRLHNEGVQVLSLSELQFIRHQSYLNASAQTGSEVDESEDKPTVDVASLKRAWANEKLALLDAIQAMKDLLTQTAAEAAQSCDGDEDLHWRSDLLRAVAELFERERGALLAELQTSVVEAHGEAVANEEISAASRLEELERRIRSQDIHQRGELERLLAADRDQLAEDLKQMKNDKKEQYEHAHERIRELQEQVKNVEESARQSQAILKQQLDCEKSRVQQEQAINEDLRTSIDAERLRTRDVLPSLQRERERTCELSSEIAAVTERAAKESASANQRIDALKADIEDRDRKLNELCGTVRELQEEIALKEKALVEERMSSEKEKALDEEVIADFRDSLASEEKRRQEAVAAVESEKRIVSHLHQDLANQRATAYEDVLNLKNKCDDLTAAVAAERNRCEELRSALDREAAMTKQVREVLEQERADAVAAREHDRAAVADLQKILEEAKRETERVQRRVQCAEQEKAVVIREMEEKHAEIAHRVEQERASRDQAMANERQARAELQTALHTEEMRKRDSERKIKELKERQHVILQRQEENKSSFPLQQDLLAHRRQLESLRQRLQLEASKFQNLVDKNHHRLSPKDLSHDFTGYPSVSLLSSDGEKLESLKRSLQDMQSELKDLYAALSLPHRSDSREVAPAEFNDRLLRHNAELSDYAAQAAREARDLREELAELEEEKAKSPSEENQQKMASRMHKMYTRYHRAESFRKSLVYQKKYLLLLLGGFQDCEEATLALIARMGAYPSSDALRRPLPHRSEAFTRFRSAVRVVIAVTRLKFLVRKWKRASTSASTAIHNKHGVASSSSVNGASASLQPTRLRSDLPSSSHHAHYTRTPSPQLDGSVSPALMSRASDSYVYSGRSRADIPVHDASYPEYSTTTSPYDGTGVGRPSYRSSYEGDTSSNRRLSPATAAAAYSSLNRSNPADSESLNEYIRKLENIQHKLGQGAHRYPR